MSDAHAIGIDCGSTFCKGALLSAEGECLKKILKPSGWDLAATGRAMVEEFFQFIPTGSAKVPVVATGYGRSSIREADHTVTEISCHALGAEILRPGTRTVVDIGGQDCKVIALNKGKVTSFHMNDKCAAGSGRFLEMVLGRLDADLRLMDVLLGEEKAVPLNSTCVVFAETEIIGLLAKGASRAEILGGVAASMAGRIASLAAKVEINAPAILTGGLSSSFGLAEVLSKALKVEVQTVPDGIFAGAFGAAIAGCRL